MKRSGLFTIATAAAVAVACNTTPGRDAGLDSDSPAAIGTAGSAASAGDKAFVDDIASAHMAEIELGNLAKERATSADVKSFADMMVRDHTAGADTLKQVAGQHAIPVPAAVNDEHRELKERLMMYRGADFDREYMSAMVQGHEDVVDRLQTRASEDRFGENKGTIEPERSNNPVEAALNAYAAEALQTTRHHLDEAKRIDGMLERGTQTRR